MRQMETELPTTVVSKDQTEGTKISSHTEAKEMGLRVRPNQRSKVQGISQEETNLQILYNRQVIS